MRPISQTEAELNYSPREASKKAQRREEKAADLQEAGRPDTPTHLTADELAVWNATADLLEQRGNLTPGDGAAITMYAELVVALREEKRRMSAEGGRVIVASRVDKNGHEIVRHEVNPRWHVINDLEHQLIIFLREFGLTPLRRKYIGKTKGAGSLTLDSLLNFSKRPS
jgi:P27 family predicted phage terminase small subunit